MTMFSASSDPFGSLLKQFRKRQHCTQQELADALGIHRNTIGRWEDGSYLPESKSLILEVVRYLHLTELEARQLLDASLIAPAPFWSVPYPRNPWFTGREEMLATLHTHLRPGEPLALTQPYAVHGLGGIGKTQLALAYAYRYALEYRAVFWVGAETLEQIHASLLRIAQQLDLPELREADQPRVIAAIQHWLETRGDWLMIWDNVEDLNLLQRFLPTLRRGALLLTTRHQALGTLAHGINLRPMEEQDGLFLLLRRAKVLETTAPLEHIGNLQETMPEEYVAAQKLVRLLGGLPLALDQAGAYIEETQCGFAEYLALFEQAPLALLRERGAPAEHPASVVTTFTLAFEHLQQTHAAAAELLTACCFLAPEEIPEYLFTRQARLFSPVLQQELSDPFAFQGLVKKLLGYALIQRHPHRRTLEVHRLVQAVLRERICVQEQLVWRKRMVQVLQAAFPEVTHEVCEVCERLVPHALVCAANLPNQEADPQVLAEVVSKTADYLRQRAHYGQAELLYQRAQTLLEQVTGSDTRLQEVSLLTNLAILYRAQGKYEQAETLYEQTLHILEQSPDLEHLYKARLLYNFGMLYQDQGKYEQAERVFEQSLYIAEQVWGSEHSHVASAFHGLADVYFEQEKNEQAVAFYQRALRLWEQAFGPEHLSIAYPLHNLAILSQRRGESEQAEKLFYQALHIIEQAVGPEHPQVAYPVNGLADFYVEQGKYEQAERLYQRAFHIRQKALGDEHVDLAASLNGLANLYQKQGKDEQAKLLYQRALALREQHLGQHHPRTAQTLYDLACFWQKQGNLCEALSLVERALKIRAQSLGGLHPKTVATQVYHAQLLQAIELTEVGSSLTANKTP